MIELKNISKTFDSDEGGVDALKDVSLTIADGDIYGIIGMSGAGKRTLVRCINLLERRRRRKRAEPLRYDSGAAQARKTQDHDDIPAL